MGDYLSTCTTVAEDPGPWALFIYGDPGGGKTVLAAQAEGVVLLDCENGRRALLNHPELVDTPLKVVDSYNSARQVVLDIDRANDERVLTVGVDTVSTLHTKDLNKQMRELPEGRDPDLPSQAEFNKNNRRLSKFCEELIGKNKKAGRNTILLCHMTEEKDKDGALTLTRPSISAGFLKLVAPMVDGMFYLQHRAKPGGGVERTLYTQPTSKIIAKNRIGTLPNQIKDPHFSMIEQAAEEQRQLGLKLLAEKQNN